VPKEAKILVYLVEDDLSVRQALEMLLLSAGMKVKAFESAEDLLRCKIREEGSCLVADTTMKGIGGLGLQRQLAERGVKIPVIFLTGLDTNETRKKAKQAGGAGYLRKPVDDQALLDTIRWALSGDSVWKE